MAARSHCGTALAAGLALAAAIPAGAQVGFDRPGGDYTSFVVRTGDPALCAARCERESRCRAWSFVYPGIAGPSAICWLKSEVRRRVENPCCVAGVRGTGVVLPHRPGTEFSIDRPGGDYRSFDVPPDADGSPCEAACKADTNCRAWTYMRPGYWTSRAHCFLKDHLRPPSPEPCCVSGVVR